MIYFNKHDTFCSSIYYEITERVLECEFILESTKDIGYVSRNSEKGKDITELQHCCVIFWNKLILAK